MDEAVIRAIQRWPNVPAVFGWLRLDRRGTWLIKTTAGRFEPVVNRGMFEFIGRNYAQDPEGRWYFQNGPQRVFVGLAYTPWIYRLNDAAAGVATHTGAAPRELRGLFLDENQSLLLETDLGIGVLLDRHLPDFLTHVQPHTGDLETTFEAVASGRETSCRLFGRKVSLAPVRADEVAQRFRFVPQPAPPRGQPDCA